MIEKINPPPAAASQIFKAQPRISAYSQAEGSPPHTTAY